jgi:hypothetical protein
LLLAISAAGCDFDSSSTQSCGLKLPNSGSVLLSFDPMKGTTRDVTDCVEEIESFGQREPGAFCCSQKHSTGQRIMVNTPHLAASSRNATGAAEVVEPPQTTICFCDSLLGDTDIHVKRSGHGLVGSHD